MCTVICQNVFSPGNHDMKVGHSIFGEVPPLNQSGFSACRPELTVCF